MPAQACLGAIVAAIDAAHEQIRVQAYGFSSRPILRALAAARERGIDVQVILDKSEAPAMTDDPGGDAGPGNWRRGHHVGAIDMARSGVPVWIDDEPAVAHNKLILIDKHLVIGGSYNYTAAAERRNAENVTFIDSAEVAAWFLENWASRRAVSRPFDWPPAAAPATAGSLTAACAPFCAR